MTSSRSAELGLLLADAQELRPTLATGLPEDTAGGAPRPEKVPRGVDGLKLEQPGADPNDLSLQRWGLIVPDSPVGKERLAAISQLCALREQEQGSPPRVYECPAGMSLEAAVRFRRDKWLAEKERERPKYLLVLGDLDEVSLEVQHVFTGGAFVGRLHAADLDGYAEYARKVVRWTHEPTEDDLPEARFFVADDGTTATAQALTFLVEPCLQLAGDAERFPAAAVTGPLHAAGARDFLTAGDTRRPAVLLSVSHGLGRPRKGWKSYDAQRRLQGSLLVGSALGDERVLAPEDLRRTPFLPGGFWFCLACFGAGTPAQSSFHAWIKQLAEPGELRAQVAHVLESLPREGEAPFLAATPQAALANPEGPLAVVAHVDLAWTFSFLDPEQSQAPDRAMRIFSALEVMARGSRAGVALAALRRAYLEVNDELLSDYQAEEDARADGRPSPIDPRRRANAFMLRNDLRGYVLLGDPAVRLPLRDSARGPRRSDGAASSLSPEDMESAVLELLAGAAPAAVAARLRVTEAALDGWVSRYRAAGRAALAELR
jgi:hypothetical protein